MAAGIVYRRPTQQNIRSGLAVFWLPDRNDQHVRAGHLQAADLPLYESVRDGGETMKKIDNSFHSNTVTGTFLAKQ